MRSPLGAEYPWPTSSVNFREKLDAVIKFRLKLDRRFVCPGIIRSFPSIYELKLLPNWKRNSYTYIIHNFRRTVEWTIERLLIADSTPISKAQRSQTKLFFYDNKKQKVTFIEKNRFVTLEQYRIFSKLVNNWIYQSGSNRKQKTRLHYPTHYFIYLSSTFSINSPATLTDIIHTQKKNFFPFFRLPEVPATVFNSLDFFTLYIGTFVNDGPPTVVFILFIFFFQFYMYMYINLYTFVEDLNTGRYTYV